LAAFADNKVDEMSRFYHAWMAALVDSVASRTGSGMFFDFTISGPRKQQQNGSLVRELASWMVKFP